MTSTEKIFRVLIVDDNRDGADALGLLLEELDNQVHVTYGGVQALEVAKAFSPGLILVDLLMPGMDGCTLVSRLRQLPGFDDVKIVAITGQKSEEYKTRALEAGCDLVFYKPVTLAAVRTILHNLLPNPVKKRTAPATRLPLQAIDQGRLPIDEARRLRNQRTSKSLTQDEIEAAICDGIIRFQDEYLGWRGDQIRTHLINSMLLVRIRGVLNLAEQQLGKSNAPEKGRDLIKQTRKQLLEMARPMLGSLIHEVTGVKVCCMHHDISTTTGEEVVIFSLVEPPKFSTDRTLATNVR